MSSQASSAGRDEAKVRQKLVETGAVDVMIDIRGNFFYTRTVPCQLWFFDRAKERDEVRCDYVLMLDARNIYRKVSRAIFDFSPEQQKNIAAIVWLHRGNTERFLRLVESYLAQALDEGQAAAGPLLALEEALGKQIDLAGPFATEARDPDPLVETWAELTSAQVTLSADIETFADRGCSVGLQNGSKMREQRHAGTMLRCMRRAKDLHDTAERCRDLTNQIDLAAKLAGRAVDIAVGELDARRIGPLGQYGHQHGAQGAGERTGQRSRSATPGAVFREPGRLATGAIPRCQTARCRGVSEARQPRRD